MNEISELLQKELNQFVGEINTPSACHAVKSLIMKRLGEAHPSLCHHFDIYVGASRVDPCIMIISPLNCLTGMVMLDYPYPLYNIPKLMGKYYEDFTGTYLVFVNEDGDPAFEHTPAARV